ncbi:MAG: class I SAM-dependent methyltransferase [Candidatus Omnitrophota bacterium]
MKILLNKSYNLLRDIYLESINFTDKTKLLDIGCGLRGNFLKLPKFVYTGVDANKHIIAKLRKKSDGLYECMDANDLKFENNFFDYIISTSFFHHCSKNNIRAIVEQIKKILKDSGKIIIADGVYPDSKINILGYLIRFFDRGRFVRRKDEFRELFENFFIVKKEVYFVNKFFAYYVLVMEKK